MKLFNARTCNKWLPYCAAAIFVSLSLPSGAQAQSTTLKIIGVPQEEHLKMLAGDAWTLYLDGEVDKDAGKRLEAYLRQNNVPDQSWVYLNSPGGNLFAGMELGRVIRNHELRTAVGKQNLSSNSSGITAGECFSSCTLAYLGGTFRYLDQKSRFGVHRFAFTSRSANDADLAQIVSAAIVSYVQEMQVNTEFFSLTTKAAPAEIREPDRADLERLGVVNGGFGLPRWTIESAGPYVYLKGERDTIHGINKFILACPKKGEMIAHVIFDTQHRDAELMSSSAHTLMLDEEEYKVSPISKKIVNGWLNVMFVLSKSNVARMRKAKSVGLMVQPLFGAPVFLGFDSMPFADGSKRLEGITSSCGVSTRAIR